MITLTDPDLGSIELRSAPFAVDSFTIGSRTTRAVVRNRALASGAYDDTRFGSTRAVTIALVLNETDCGPDTDRTTMQELYHRILPFMQPRRRPVMTWSLPGSGGVMRQMTVRGDSAPVQIARGRHPALVLSFVAPDGEITTPGVRSTLIDPATDTEEGRIYSTGSELKFDRNYPTSLAVGDRAITQDGNDDAHWRLSIFGGAVNPFFRINDVLIDFASNGGLTLSAGTSVVIDTKERTVYLNDDPATPRYDRTNFADWAWGDLLLKPGANLVRFGADTLTGGQALLEWYDTWAGWPVADRISFAVGPWTGTAPVQPVTRFSTATVKGNLGAGPEVTLTVPGNSPAALLIDGLATDLWVYRNGALYRRCRILPVAQGWGADAQNDAEITAVGYRRVVEARHIISGPPTYTSVDQGAILKGLIDHTQAQTGGSLGVTFGTYLTGVLRTRTEYKIGDNLGSLMGAIGNVLDGCWWGIDANLVMTALLWDDFPTRTDPIVYGMNARAMKRTPSRSFANVAGAVGSATDTVPNWAVDASVATDPRGRWEVFDSSHGSTTTQATVNGYASGLLARSLHPPSTWTIELDPDDYFEGSSNYAEGEFVQIVVPTSAVDEIGPPANVIARITEVSIGVTEDGGVTVNLAAVETATV